MPRLWYEDKRPRGTTLDLIEQANIILYEYAAQGLSLTLRQVYYQFVARGLFENDDRNYKALGRALQSGRLSGMVDWSAIVDRTRYVRELPHWGSPVDILESAADSFRLSRWETQKAYPEVWIEKDAAIGVIETICNRYDVPYFSGRGYSGTSALWEREQRLLDRLRNGKEVVVLYLGDHDPSGLDMTRSIEEKLDNLLFVDLARYRYQEKQDMEGAQDYASVGIQNFRVERLALNMDQVEQYNPPPNPAKLTDTRARGYIAEYGPSSWELDALEPSVVVSVIEGAVTSLIDGEEWNRVTEVERAHKDSLKGLSDRWTDVEEWLGEAR